MSSDSQYGVEYGSVIYFFFFSNNLLKHVYGEIKY